MVEGSDKQCVDGRKGETGKKTLFRRCALLIGARLAPGVLLESGAEVNAKDGYYRTPLH